MAIAANVLTSGVGNFSGTNLSTASVTPGANRLVLACFGVAVDVNYGADNNFSVAGNGLTWVRMEETQQNRRSCAVFRSMGASPSSGAITLTEASASSVGQNGSWVIVEFSGVETSGTNGSGAVGTVASNSGNSIETLGLTIAGTPATGDVTFASFAMEDGKTAFTSDALWDTLADTNDVGTEVQTRVDWDTGQDQSPTWTWVGEASTGVIGFIIKAVVSTSPLVSVLPQNDW